MRIATALAVACAMSGPASADVATVVADDILPAFARLTAATRALSDTAAADCSPPAMRPAYQSAFDAWMGVAHLRLGPSETAALSIAFWPDERGATPKTLSRMIAAGDEANLDPAAYAEASAAARGFFALDMLLYDDAFAGYAPGGYSCRLAATIAEDLARQATAVEAGWRDGFAEALATAGKEGNAVFLSEAEAQQALYTQLLAGLEFVADQRLGRPLGTFERPRPARAEAWRSGRPLPNVVLSLQALEALAKGLAARSIPKTDAAFGAAYAAAANIDDPGFQDIDDPQARLRVEILQQRINAVRDAVKAEIGDALGLKAGFNAQDGD